MEGQEQAPRLLVQVRNVLRLHHYSIHTERSYVDWIKRYVHFHHMRCREDLADGERKIEAFLTDLPESVLTIYTSADPSRTCSSPATPVRPKATGRVQLLLEWPLSPAPAPPEAPGLARCSTPTSC